MVLCQGAIIQRPIFLTNISQVSVYASPEKWSQTHYALEASLKLLDFYENYFDINYPLPKLGRDKVYVIVFIFAYMICFNLFLFICDLNEH